MTAGIVQSFRSIWQHGLTTHFVDPEPGDALLSAREIRRVVQRNEWCKRGYLEVDSPMQDETSGAWMLQVFITDLAQQMIALHDQGMVWNTETHAIDIPETIRWYHSFLHDGYVLDSTMRLVASLTNPAFKPLIENYIHFKLLAEKDDRGAWYLAPEDRACFAKR